MLKTNKYPTKKKNNIFIHNKPLQPLCVYTGWRPSWNKETMATLHRAVSMFVDFSGHETTEDWPNRVFDILKIRQTGTPVGAGQRSHFAMYRTFISNSGQVCTPTTPNEHQMSLPTAPFAMSVARLLLSNDERLQPGRVIRSSLPFFTMKERSPRRFFSSNYYVDFVSCFNFSS